MVAMTLVMILMFTCIVETSFATEIESEKQMVYTYTTTEEERDRIFEEEMEKIMAELNQDSITRGPKYHYKSENLEYQYKTVEGYAGNQLRDGYRFPTGGGFFYSDDGGPEITVDLSLNLPGNWDFLSVGISLGTKVDSSGEFVQAPNKTDYFKLYIEKESEIRPYVVYRKRSGMDGEWEIDHTGAVPITVALSAYAKKV